MNINFSALPLSELSPGQRGSIYAVLGPGRWVQLRLSALGLRPGAVVQVLGYGPGRGPILLEVNGTRVALGRGVARRILVIPEKN
ncbi:MAG: FeoA family protein [Candidatus Bipolaricaulaceae bacterium]